MSRTLFLGVFALFCAGCGSDGSATNSPTKPGEGPKPGPMCTAAAETEAECRDAHDDDCDGFVDCLDSECDGQPCGDGLTCSGGACRKPCAPGDTTCVPELPGISNIKVDVRGDTVVIEFEPVAGAKDYRIYPEPSAEAWLIGDDGSVGVKDGIYRCAGDGVFQDRQADVANGFDCSITGCDNARHDYQRTEAEAVLGYVYLTPAADRLPVWRIADPNGGGGFRNSNWVVPLYSEANSAEYVVDPATREALLAKGWRDDGIAFYTSKAATKKVYRIKYAAGADWQGDNVVFFFTEGPEHDTRAAQPAADIEDLGVRFQVLETQEPGSVALHRVTYPGSFDVLAAGDARFDQVLHQGVRPVWSVSWPGIRQPTRFIVEALDAGCPFPNGYIAAEHKDADVDRTSMEPFNYPSLTLDEARLSSGEVFVNGQHDPNNRPKPLARAYVDVKPEPQPEFDFLATFDEGAAWEPLTKWQDNNAFVFRNSQWAIDTSGCTENFAFGPVLGQLLLGFADGGSSCNVSITPKQVPTAISADEYLHVRMSTDVPSTNRRYPQILITTVPLKADPAPGATYIDDVPVHSRLGNFPFDWQGKDMKAGTADDVKPEGGQSIVVQPFGGYQETQIEYCDTRGWGVSQQCDRANVYGFHAGDDKGDEKQAWTAVPVQGNLAGYDRPVQWDVYTSTERVYVFMDGKPAACAVLPAGRMPQGPVTVAYRAVLYHCGIDEAVVPDDTGHVYEHNYSLCHSDRKLDDLGIELAAPKPAWDESLLPCGSEWYGGSN
jgi:copper chaperone CopZ